MSDHKSVIARLGQIGQKYTDPLAWAFGRKYTDKLVDIADFSNKAGSTVGRPLVKADKTLNPLRRIGAYNKVASWTEAKPADTGAIAAGGYFGAGALGGAGTSGYAAGGSGAGAAGGSGAAGATGASIAGGAAEAIPEVVVTGTAGGGSGAAVGAGAGAGGATTANSNGNNWRDQMQMPGQQDDSQQTQADEDRRQLEAMMEQERLRRESFRRNEIARSMLS